MASILSTETLNFVQCHASKGNDTWIVEDHQMSKYIDIESESSLITATALQLLE